MCKINRYYAQINNDCAFPLVPALDAEPQKDRPYQSDFYRVGFNAIPRQAREQDRFDPSLRGGCLVWHTVEPLFSD